MSTPMAIVSVMGGVDRILEVEVIDKAGRETDTAKITLDDRDFTIEAPPTGSSITIAMGYKESGVFPMGTFIVDEIEVEGPPYCVIVHAKSADQKSAQKQHRTTKYEDKSLGDMVQEIAGRHGLSASVGGQLSSRKYKYEHQNEESDWHFLTRLANENDAISSIKNGKWLFVPRAGGQSGGGLDMPTVSLVLTDLIHFRAAVRDRPKHKDAKSGFHDHKKGKVQIDKAQGSSGGSASYGLRHLHPNKDIAKYAREAKVNELTRNEGSCSAVITGDPSIMAGGIVTFSTGRSILDDEWVIQSVTHKIVPGEAYTTTIEGQSKNGNQNNGGGGGKGGGEGGGGQ